MTEPRDQPSALPPEQEAVRRLLADARHDGPTPPEVVARLDATLASLAAGREPVSPTATTTTASVIDLGARRRRMVGAGLLAAAAVVVAGVALGQNLPSMQGSDDASSASGGEAATSQQDDAGAGSDSDSGGTAASPEESPESSLKSSAPAPFAAYPTLSSDDADLDEDLLSLRRRAARNGSAFDTADLTRACGLSQVGPGRWLLAEVDGRTGVVVFRRPDGASQQVDLYSCDDPTIVRTLTLPAP